MDSTAAIARVADNGGALRPAGGTVEIDHCGPLLTNLAVLHNAVSAPLRCGTFSLST
jgi:hypothetical protein